LIGITKPVEANDDKSKGAHVSLRLTDGSVRETLPYKVVVTVEANSMKIVCGLLNGADDLD